MIGGIGLREGLKNNQLFFSDLSEVSNGQKEFHFLI